ncbi:MAG: iron-dependent repressor [Flavobacteriales bacterium TMED123]|nr:MAG: iron-dependent repressor [Flavobacteriales bacterium TMED123]
MYTLAEENYLKAILTINLQADGKVTTNAIAQEIGTSAASVSDMLKKLQDKKLIKYEKYKGVSLSKKGEEKAINILRKHRLWETFLVNKLEFSWDEVHYIAEQLEHIKAEKLIDKLDAFLDYPKFDPHGEPIPTKEGKIAVPNTTALSDLAVGTRGKIMGVILDDSAFLQYLNQLDIQIGTEIEILDKIDFDKSIAIKVQHKKQHISNDVAKHLLIKKQL